MSPKSVTYFCLISLLIQQIAAQCLKNSLSYPAAPLMNDIMPISGPCGTGLAASNGGGLSVTSASPIAPTGLTVTSENAMEGQVAVGGQLPLIGSVAMDAAFPSAGAGAISYGCGDGSIGIVNEAPIAAPSPAITPATNAISPATPAIVPSSPAIAAAAPAISAPVPAISNPASALLGSSFKFGPGKSPFGGAPFPGQPGFGPRGPVGRGCGFRY